MQISACAAPTGSRAWAQYSFACALLQYMRLMITMSLSCLTFFSFLDPPAKRFLLVFSNSTQCCNQSYSVIWSEKDDYRSRPNESSLLPTALGGYPKGRGQQYRVKKKKHNLNLNLYHGGTVWFRGSAIHLYANFFFCFKKRWHRNPNRFLNDFSHYVKHVRVVGEKENLLLDFIAYKKITFNNEISCIRPPTLRFSFEKQTQQN